MARKRTPPILEKLRRLLRTSSLSLSKTRGSAKKLKLLKHFGSHGFIQEYDFSSCSTPLKQRKRRDLQSMLELVFVCFGDRISRNDYWNSSSMEEVEVLPEEKEKEKVDNDEDGYSASVDERAERFIHGFYQQMRLQGRFDSGFLLCDSH